MDCIYFLKGDCKAQPVVRRTRRGVVSSVSPFFYTPNEEEQNNYCKNGDGFRTCPRFLAYHDHLKAMAFRGKES